MPGTKAKPSKRRAQILDAAAEVAASEGLKGLTIRRVADAAGLSHGLVHFHFSTKDDLVAALLGRVLGDIAAAEAVPASAGDAPPLTALLGVMRSEMARLTTNPGATRLFFDFWVMGAGDPGIQSQMSGELARYREAFRPLVRRVIEADPVRFAHVTEEGLCAVVVAFLKGSALQSVIDPDAFDDARFLDAASALLGQIESR